MMRIQPEEIVGFVSFFIAAVAGFLDNLWREREVEGEDCCK